MAPLKSSSTNFSRGPSVTLKTVFFVVLSVIIMTADRQTGSLDAFRSGLALLVYPVRAAVDLPYTAWNWFAESLDSRGDLIEANRELRREQLELRGQLQRFAALEEENERLRALLESSRQLEAEVQVGELLRADLDPFRHRVTINLGTRDGIVDGEAIIDARGVVGQVTNAAPITADAILITDPSHATPVEINRNGLRTVALGTGSLDRLELPFLPNSADIREGDLLVTSGLGQRFPQGYPVAVVDTIQRDPGQAFAQITARPIAALDRLREVLIVATESPGDVDSNVTPESTDSDTAQPESEDGERRNATEADNE
ncbi:MAG: rod shape-determining protein MreC [Gammaproteobacteria bacterium]|nr:rod shape-determining protein MreC [Gammaproteobacteria bacterium]